MIMCILLTFSNWPFPLELCHLFFNAIFCMYVQYSSSSLLSFDGRGSFSSLSYCCWNYNYLCNQCLSPIKLWRVILNTLCDEVCQWLATGQWFSSVSSTNKNYRHDITEILLKVALNTINQHTIWWNFISIWYVVLMWYEHVQIVTIFQTA